MIDRCELHTEHESLSRPNGTIYLLRRFESSQCSSIRFVLLPLFPLPPPPSFFSTPDPDTHAQSFVPAPPLPLPTHLLHPALPPPTPAPPPRTLTPPPTPQTRLSTVPLPPWAAGTRYLRKGRGRRLEEGEETTFWHWSWGHRRIVSWRRPKGGTCSKSWRSSREMCVPFFLSVLLETRPFNERSRSQDSRSCRSSSSQQY